MRFAQPTTRPDLAAEPVAPSHQPKDVILVPPSPHNVQVGLLLKEKSDTELIQFGHAHITAMEDNALFPDPQPTKGEFAQSLEEFEQSVIELHNLRLRLQSLIHRKDKLRKAFETDFSRRGRYVEVRSGGNPNAIATTALPARRKASKSVGALLWPENLELTLDPRTSTLIVSWYRVRGARAYVMEIAECVEGQPLDWKLAWTGSRLRTRLTTLTPGKTYAIRIATIGGSTGQSPWSPHVTRMVA